MKKTKLLMPILGVGVVAATVAPMVAMTGCNKEEAAMKVVSISTNDSINFTFTLKYSKFIQDHSYAVIEDEWDHEDEIGYFNIDGFNDDISNGEVQFKEELAPGQTTKVTATFKLKDKETEKETGPFTVVLICVGKAK
ncbi:MAG: hypothetical protein ACOQNV_03295 [Mycoplasmoidaceae bacterium]